MSNESRDGGEPYFLKKNGYYYRHNNEGYTSSIFEAEVYSEEYAKGYAEGIEEISAVAMVDVISSWRFFDCLARIEKMQNWIEYQDSLGVPADE